jgi:signal transduction histidine kinase/ligand-binding sensor domain-containing protein
MNSPDQKTIHIVSRAGPKSIQSSPISFLTKLFFILSLIIIAFPTSACQGSKISPSELSPPDQSLNLPPEQETDYLISGSILSPGQNLRFENISLEEGLSQSTVFATVQDHQGFLWFATEDGLNRYDGYDFTIYKHDPADPFSLRDNWILSLLVDQSGTLWIGTREGGLDRYDRESDQFIHYQYDPGDPASLNDNEVTALYQDRAGFIWAGTHNGGLNIFDPEDEVFTHYQHDPDDANSLSSNSVTIIFEDSEGIFWIGTDDAGLNQFDPEVNNWKHFSHDPGEPQSLSHNFVKTIIEDSSGNLWVGTVGGGIERFDPINDQFIHFHPDFADPDILSSDATSVIYQDRTDMVWVGTEGSGFYNFDPATGIFINFQHNPGDPQSVSSNYIVSIFEDREGLLWFGTFGTGVNKLNAGWRNFPHFQNIPNNPNSLSDNMVRAFVEDSNGDLWIGSLDGGVDRFDRENNLWSNYRHNPDEPGSLSHNFVSAIIEDSSKNIWVGTANGLDRFDPQPGTFTHFQPDHGGLPGTPSNNIRAIHEMDEGQFWIGTKGGLYRFDSKEEDWSEHYFHDPANPLGLSENWIFSLLEDSEGILWLGTFGGGLNRFDPINETFTPFQYDPEDPASISDSFNPAIIQDSEGSIWVATSGGLDRYDPETGTFDHFRETDGLANNTIYCGLEDAQGYIWLGTAKGLSKLDPQNETFINYDVEDGLQSNEFNGASCYKNDTGEMFFGGINGFNAFFPDRVQDNQVIPPIVLTSLTQEGMSLIHEKGITFLEEVTLKWPDNNFEFEFSALSYSNPRKNLYAYKLEGFDRDWIEIGTRRYGKYTNLAGGTYTLRMIGSNNDGVWNEDGSSVKITVVPPFWGTWLFRGLIIAAVIGASYGGYKLRVRNLEKRSRDLEIQVKDRTDELMKTHAALRETDLERAVLEERNRLARELHDSVTQSLYSLTLFTEAARHLSEAIGDEKLEGYLGQIGNLGLGALKEMRLLVFELGLHALEEDDLVEALEKRLKAVEGRTGVDAKVINEGYQKQPSYIETQLFKIAQEALNNALKHANASSVEVHFLQDGPTLEMEIVDDGVGFEPDSLNDGPGMGLKNIKDRVDRMDGKLEIDSGSGKGTRLKVSIKTDGQDEKK